MKYRQAKKFLKQEMATAIELLNSNPLNGSANAMYKFTAMKLAELKKRKKKK
jgi:hypothetical protein